MVVAQEPLAADVGLSVLKNGGNAVDAAVAVGFALAVTHPVAGNLGGGGFMLIRFADGRTTFFDFRECAPLKASRDMYIGPDGNATRDSIYGWRSSGVPGSVAGFQMAKQRFGSKPWAELLAPAVKLARDGFPVNQTLAESFKSDKKIPRGGPRVEAHFPAGRQPLPARRDLPPAGIGSNPRNASLASGARDFYEGETAKRLAAAMAAHGGLITEADLRAYKAVTALTPAR